MILCNTKWSIVDLEALYIGMVKSYLNNRKRFVRYQSCDSEYKHIKCGVPQESILSSLLSLL